MSQGKVQSTSTLNNWAGYVDRINRQDLTWSLWLLIKYIPNRLTLFNSEIYYKKENYLKVKTAAFKYTTSPIVKGLVHWYISISVYYTSVFPRSHVLSFTIWLSYPLSYGFTSSISPTSYVLIFTQYKSLFSTCTILFIKSVTPASFSLSLSLKSFFISKSLIKSVLCPVLI